jgi:hypothetical protein
MSADEERRQASETGDQEASETLDQAAQGGEGTSPAQGAQPIEGSEQQSDQTQVSGPDDDVGVPDVERRTE